MFPMSEVPLYPQTPPALAHGSIWRKGSARALDTHIHIVCEEDFTEEKTGPLHVRDYTSF